MIIAIVCLLFACSVLGQNQPADAILYTYIGAAAGSDWKDGTKWSTADAAANGAFPSKILSYAYFPNTDATSGPVTMAEPYDIYGVDYRMPYDPAAMPTPLLGFLTLNNNLTAHEIDVGNGRVVQNNGTYLNQHNATSTLEVSGTNSQFDCWGWIGHLVTISAGTLNVYPNGRIESLDLQDGVTNVWGHVETITATSSTWVLNIYGTVSKIDVSGYSGTINVYKGAKVTWLNPAGEVYVWPGSNIDTIASTTDTDFYFKYVDKNENTIDINSFTADNGADFYSDNGTVVNFNYYNTSTGSSTNFRGLDCWFNFLGDSYFQNVYLYSGNLVATIKGKAWIVYGGSYGIYIQELCSLINQGWIGAENSIRIETYALFHNDKTGIVESTNTDTDTNGYSCYFYGESTYDSGTSLYTYPTLTNDGIFMCERCQFYQTNVMNNGNITSNNMGFSGYDTSDPSRPDQPTFWYTAEATNEQQINLCGTGGKIVFQGDHDVWGINICGGSYYGFFCEGNTTVRWTNVSANSYVYIYTSPTVWLLFDYFESNYGRYYIRGKSSVIFNGNFFLTYSGGTFEIEGGSTLIFGENSYTTTDGTNTLTFNVDADGTLRLQGIIDEAYSVDINLETGTSTAVNQGKITAQSFDVDTYDSADPGYWASVGSLTVDDINLYDTSAGNCGITSIFTLRNLQSDNDWNTYLDYYGEYAANGIMDLVVGPDFDSAVWDDGGYNYILYGYSGAVLQSWISADEVSAWTRTEPPLTNPLDLGGKIKFCQDGTDVYAYSSDSAKPSACTTTAPIIDPDITTNVCAVFPGGLPDPTDPTGGPTGPTAPGTTPGTNPEGPVTPGPVTPGTPITPGPVTPGTPITPGPVTPGTPITPGPVTPGTPVTPGPVSPDTPVTPTGAPSSAGNLSFSVVVSFILSYYLFRMFQLCHYK